MEERRLDARGAADDVSGRGEVHADRARERVLELPERDRPRASFRDAAVWRERRRRRREERVVGCRVVRRRRGFLRGFLLARRLRG
jgi:hypothetical protein